MSKKSKKIKNRSKVKQDNTMLWILIVILVVCFALIGFLFYKYFYSGISSSKYGARLEGIENYKLSDTLQDDISSVFEKEKSVGSATVNVEGKVIYLTVDFVQSIKVENAKTIAIKALNKIGEDNLKFYEVQFILTYSGSTENSNFPVFGSKNANSLKVVW